MIRFAVFLPMLLLPFAARAEVPLGEIKAPEAHQGVAVDGHHVFAIGNRTIAKYDKYTGARVKVWEASEEIPLTHLNSGMVQDNQLICTHSNYPDIPMTSSVEIWDTTTLEHVGSHSFGIAHGSLTWLDRHDGHWWACFVHYSGRGGYPDKDNRYSVVVKMNDTWQELESWVFPADLLQRFNRHSASGGSWGPDGLLYVTGHDEAELYGLVLPVSGAALKLVNTVPFPIAGQAIAFDRSGTGLLYGIVRSRGLVVAAPLSAPEGNAAE